MKGKPTFHNIAPAFSSMLRKKVDDYFKVNEKHATGNYKAYWKTAILFTTALAFYNVLMFDLTPIWVSVLICILLGLNLAGIGFNVMHEGAHGSFSSRKWVNDMMSHSLEFMGGSSYMWKQKHNMNHHAYTNIEGLDDDIDIKPWIRTNNNQPRRWYHRYQHIYWVLLYGFTYFIWVFSQDFQKYFTRKIADTPLKKMKTKDHVIFWSSKILYVFTFLIIPMFMLGFWPTVIGYAIISFTCGWVIAVVFQLAHLIEDSSFPMPDANSNKIEQEWTIHQLTTTANFSTRNKITSWFTGGLNFQIEHHLFPKINHVHYPAISKLVKEVCEEFNVTYMEYPSVLSALRSHVGYLKTAGSQN
ncbi:MAG: acyl-CoA desaturase [Bacteroidota bacterium]